jgi:hypothetical protein
MGSGEEATVRAPTAASESGVKAMALRLEDLPAGAAFAGERSSEGANMEVFRRDFELPGTSLGSEVKLFDDLDSALVAFRAALTAPPKQLVAANIDVSEVKGLRATPLRIPAADATGIIASFTSDDHPLEAVVLVMQVDRAVGTIVALGPIVDPNAIGPFAIAARQRIESALARQT